MRITTTAMSRSSTGDLKGEEGGSHTRARLGHRASSTATRPLTTGAQDPSAAAGRRRLTAAARQLDLAALLPDQAPIAEPNGHRAAGEGRQKGDNLRRLQISLPWFRSKDHISQIGQKQDQNRDRAKGRSEERQGKRKLIYTTYRSQINVPLPCCFTRTNRRNEEDERDKGKEIDVGRQGNSQDGPVQCEIRIQ